MVAHVLVEIQARKMVKTFTYLVPHELQDKIQIGIRVLVPFNNRKLEGFVLKIDTNFTSSYELKNIIALIDNHPVINEEMLELGKLLSKKTFTNLISVYQTMLPKALKAKSKTIINKKYETYLVLNSFDNNEITSSKQKQIIDLFKDKKQILKKEASKISSSAVKTLLNKNILSENKIEDYRLNDDIVKEEKKVVLNNDQQNVVNKVLKFKQKFAPFLLHGVTGSGKTEVYMHIIEKIIAEKKEVIVLVPEISLTPQLVNTFRKRFGKTIAILHSGLSDGEKYDEWRKIEKKEVMIAIGARSAIFAPFTNLGLIIIDEEHSATYKQENNPRYNAIEVGMYRAKKYNCPIILGSATPSIESYTKAKMNYYTLLEMPKRINNTLPKIELIDMKESFKHGYTVLSKIAIDKINDRLEKKEQIMLLLNRRGYTTTISCPNCGYVHKCPNCDIPLTYHKTYHKMTCHYCNYQTYKINSCPKCHNQKLLDLGMGTEKLEEKINDIFKSKMPKIIRMDIDTTRRKGSHAKIIEDFKNHKYDILIGTQMISKGLDFPNVTLVIVVNGDASLNIPDFRSAERTFSLLNQVAGRSGRGKLSGEVIIQGYNIDHYSMVYASKNDYLGFYKEEMAIRKVLKYPPFYNLCLIKLRSNIANTCLVEGNKIVKYLKNQLTNEIILGPSACSLPKINNVYYFQIIIKYKKINNLIKPLEFINKQYLTNNKIIVEIDLNPNKI